MHAYFNWIRSVHEHLNEDMTERDLLTGALAKAIIVSNRVGVLHVTTTDGLSRNEGSRAAALFTTHSRMPVIVNEGRCIHITAKKDKAISPAGHLLLGKKYSRW